MFTSPAGKIPLFAELPTHPDKLTPLELLYLRVTDLIMDFPEHFVALKVYTGFTIYTFLWNEERQCVFKLGVNISLEQDDVVEAVFLRQANKGLYDLRLTNDKRMRHNYKRFLKLTSATDQDSMMFYEWERVLYTSGMNGIPSELSDSWGPPDLNYQQVAEIVDNSILVLPADEIDEKTLRFDVLWQQLREEGMSIIDFIASES